MVGRKRTVIAHHEAGHAVIARKLGIPVARVSARDRVALTHSAGWSSMNVADIEARAAAYESDAVVALAGLAAQRRLRGYEDMFVTDNLLEDDWDEDMANARSAIYRAICLRTGKPLPDGPFSVTVGPPEIDAITETFDRLQTQTIRLVRERWPAIARVAKALGRHDTIDQTELDRLIAVALPAR
jgi:hypothetical protein